MLRKLFLRVWLALACVSVATTATAPSFAQDEAELAEARAKFQRGLELERAKNHGGALKLFREVGQVKMTPQVRYHIALNEEGLGQLVAALGGYELALEQSEGMHPDFIAEVEHSIEDLRARIPKIIVERGPGADAAVISLDGVALGSTSIGAEVPVNPGPHTLAAEAPGFEDFSSTVTVQETQVVTVVVELIPLPEDQQQQGPADSDEPGYGLIPYIIGGSGVAVAATGGVLLAVSQANVSEVQQLCGGNDCSGLDNPEWQQARDLRDNALTLETVGWITAGVGVAALATGAVLYFLDPARTGEKSPETGEVSVVPAAPGAEAGLSFRATF